MELEVRFLKKCDIKETTKLISNFFNIKDMNNGYEKITRKGLDKSIIAIMNNEIIGHILIEEKYDANDVKIFYRLNYVCVKDEYQGYGIASRMLKKLEQYAKDKDIYCIQFKSSNFRKKAHACYLKNDYKKLDTTVFQKII